MCVPIDHYSPVPDNEWLDFCKQCQDATFFHTPYWADLFVMRYPQRYRKSAYKLVFDDTTEVVIPLVEKRHLFGMMTITCSMPASTYGGPLSTNPLDDEHEDAILHFLHRFPDLILRENPYRPLRCLDKSTDCVDDVTQSINLTKGYEELWKSAAYSHRKGVRSALRHGIEIVEAQHHDEWEQYSTLYTDSINRWKQRRIFSGVSYDSQFFLHIEHMAPSLRRLWLAKLQNKIIAGIICFYWNTHAVAWHGAALSEYFSMYPNNLLYDRALHHALLNGYQWFDCNPCSGLPGVYKFKQYLGAEPMKSRILVQRSPAIELVNRLRKRFGTP